jgi:hypothetical protein
MGKFYGAVGYVKTHSTNSGIWEEVITERNYSGDVIKDSRRWQTGENLNDDLTINNRISIIADDYAHQNFYTIRYLVWMGVSWKVTNIDIQGPRLILTIGGVYNGKTGPTSVSS